LKQEMEVADRESELKHHSVLVYYWDLADRSRNHEEVMGQHELDLGHLIYS
jgi:hypothetical protein